jgi:hypothetical protein
MRNRPQTRNTQYGYAIRNTQPTSNPDIRSTDTQYAIRNLPQTQIYAVRIRNTQYAAGLKPGIHNTDTQYAIRSRPQLSGTSQHPQYGYAIRNTQPASTLWNLLRYTIRIRNTDTQPASTLWNLSASTIRIRNTQYAAGLNSLEPLTIHNTDTQYAIRSRPQLSGTSQHTQYGYAIHNTQPASTPGTSGIKIQIHNTQYVNSPKSHESIVFTAEWESVVHNTHTQHTNFPKRSWCKYTHGCISTKHSNTKCKPYISALQLCPSSSPAMHTPCVGASGKYFLYGGSGAKGTRPVPSSRPGVHPWCSVHWSDSLALHPPL